MKLKNSRWTMVMVGVIAFLMVGTMVWASPPASAPSAPLQAYDAKNTDKVDGLHASKWPKANTLLALNRRKKFRASVIPGAITRDKEVMSIVKNNDGAGSGLDADLLDGQHATAFWSLTGNAGTTGSNFLGTTDNQPLAIKTNGAEAMRIDTTGNVGIGTTSPGNKLEVVGGGNDLIAARRSSSGATLGYALGIVGSADDWWIALPIHGGELRFYNVGAGLPKSVITKKDTGNVGIVLASLGLVWLARRGSALSLVKR